MPRACVRCQSAAERRPVLVCPGGMHRFGGGVYKAAGSGAMPTLLPRLLAARTTPVLPHGADLHQKVLGGCAQQPVLASAANRMLHACHCTPAGIRHPARGARLLAVRNLTACPAICPDAALKSHAAGLEASCSQVARPSGTFPREAHTRCCSACPAFRIQQFHAAGCLRRGWVQALVGEVERLCVKKNTDVSREVRGPPAGWLTHPAAEGVTASVTVSGGAAWS